MRLKIGVKHDNMAYINKKKSRKVRYLSGINYKCKIKKRYLRFLFYD